MIMRNKILITCFLIFSILMNCKTQTDSKKIISSQMDFLNSKKFKQVKNQYGELTDFIFEIDTMNKIYFDKTYFYKLNLTAYDSIYIGKSNDTIFSLDEKINFKEVFLVLNQNKTSYLGRLGTDYEVSLLNSNDSIFQYSFRKIQNTNDEDYIITGYEYPELIISKMNVTQSGKIIDLIIEQKELEN